MSLGRPLFFRGSSIAEVGRLPRRKNDNLDAARRPPMEKMEGKFRAASRFSYFRRGSRPASTTKEPLKKRGRPRLIFHSANAVQVFLSFSSSRAETPRKQELGSSKVCFVFLGPRSNQGASIAHQDTGTPGHREARF